MGLLKALFGDYSKKEIKRIKPKVDKVLELEDTYSGMSDEEKMGLKYADIHRYIREGTCGNAETDAAIRKRENANRHKRQMPVILNPFRAGEQA